MDRSRDVLESINFDPALASEFVKLVSSTGLDPKIDFINADLRNCNLNKQNLISFNFSGANLTGSSFRGTKFSDSTFSDALLFEFSNETVQNLVLENSDFRYLAQRSRVSTYEKRISCFLAMSILFPMQETLYLMEETKVVEKSEYVRLAIESAESIATKLIFDTSLTREIAREIQYSKKLAYPLDRRKLTEDLNHLATRYPRLKSFF